MRADADDESLHNDPQSAPADPADQHARIAQLQADLAQAQAERQRALADYANFQRRSIQNERDAKEADEDEARRKSRRPKAGAA